MADRVFGPIRGAGVQVREREPERNIVQGQLGSTVLIGVFERGEENEVTLLPSKKAFTRKMGGLLDSADFNAASFASLEAPLASHHFWDHSEGAGFLTCLRVVPRTVTASQDDTPDSATLEVYNREATPVRLGRLVAQNGGRWGGSREVFQGEITGTPGTDFPLSNQVQLDLTSGNLTFKVDEYKNGTVHLHGITTKTYTVVSNTADGLFTFAADEDVDADWTAAGPPTDYNVTIYRDNVNYRGVTKYLSAEFKDGALDPVGRFGLQIRVDGIVYLDWEELSMDDTSPYYWLDVINDDPNNDIVTVEDDFTGNRLADTARPANRYGESSALTSQVLTIADPVVSGLSVGGAWVPDLSWTSWGSSVVAQRLKVECTDDTAGAEVFDVTTNIGEDGAGNAARTFQATGDLSVGITFTMDAYTGVFDLGTTSGTVATGDYFYIYLRPLIVDELIGGKINPNVNAASPRVFSITDNTATTVSVSAINDLTNGAVNSAGDEYMLQWPEQAMGGYDGNIADMTTTDYEALLDSGDSPLFKLKSMNQGLVKVAVPGIAKPSAALDLQKKVKELCLAYNWMARPEIPDEYTEELDVLDWLNNSYGRLDLSAVHFPSFMYIRDPLANSGSDAREQLVSVIGMQLGREAMVARNWDGYHKAAAGTDVTLPLVVRAPVLGRPDKPTRLNEELLNPSGVNAYRWASGGSTILAWGDRTLDNTTVYKWKHKREQLSHYENVIIENFDWAIFQINDPEADADVIASVHSYFLEEWRKRAIRGRTFVGGVNPAAIIKMDEENNTDATRAQGNQNIEISLRFADTVERLNFIIGALGLTEST